jgi:hypothetical protein
MSTAPGEGPGPKDPNQPSGPERAEDEVPTSTPSPLAPEQPTAGEPSRPAAERTQDARGLYGVIVVLAGLGVTLVAFGLSLLAFDKAGSVSAALAPITGVIGTIVGAYFGVQVGSSGKAESDAARTKAEEDAKKLAAVAPSGPAMAVLQRQPVTR